MSHLILTIQQARYPALGAKIHINVDVEMVKSTDRLPTRVRLGGPYRTGVVRQVSRAELLQCVQRERPILQYGRSSPGLLTLRISRATGNADSGTDVTVRVPSKAAGQAFKLKDGKFIGVLDPGFFDPIIDRLVESYTPISFLFS